MELLLGFGVLAGLMLLWLNALATLAIKHDHTLAPFQKIAQLIFVWLIPFLGASVVLHIVYDHSPEAIPKAWIPWPFKNLIYGKPIKPNRDRDDREVDVFPGRGAEVDLVAMTGVEMGAGIRGCSIYGIFGRSGTML